MTAATAAIIGISLIGAMASNTAAKKARQQQQDQYNKEAAVRDEQIAKSEAAAQRKYEADMQNYNAAMGVYQSNLSYLNKLITDPTGHPDYAATKASLDKQFKGAKQTLKDTLRRRGRTGGVQDEILKELQVEYESQLTTITAGIQSLARQQKLGLKKPNQPYLGQGQVDWGAYMNPVTPQPYNVDLAGFGSMLALSQRMDKTTDTTDTTDSTLMKTGTSVTPYGGNLTYDELMDWALDYNMGDRVI